MVAGTHRLASALLLAALLAPALARAGATDDGRLRLVVLDVNARGTVEAARVEGLTQLLLSEAGRRPDLQVLGSGDIRSVLGFEAEKQLLACDEEASCLAEIGGAMNARFILATDVSTVGRTWLVTVSLLDVGSVEAVHRATRRASSEDDLLDGSISALNEVLAALPGAEPARPARGGGRGPLAWGLTAAGGAAVVGGGVLYALSWDTYNVWNADRSAVSLSEVQAAKIQAPLGLGLAAVGAALMAGSFLVPAPEAAPRLSVVPVDGGAVAVVGGRWP